LNNKKSLPGKGGEETREALIYTGQILHGAYQSGAIQYYFKDMKMRPSGQYFLEKNFCERTTEF